MDTHTGREKKNTWKFRILQLKCYSKALDEAQI